MSRLLSLVKTNWIALTFLVLVGITLLSLWPVDELPQTPGTDKTHHLIAYAVLMFPAALRKPRKWMLIGLLFVAYSGAIELAQPYVNRHADWLDMAANTTGVVCGFIIAELVNRSSAFISNRSRR